MTYILIAAVFGLLGLSIRHGIEMKSAMKNGIDKISQNSKYILNRNKVHEYNNKANLFISIGVIGIIAVYAMVLFFLPGFFFESLLGLVPFAMGFFGYFLT